VVVVLPPPLTKGEKRRPQPENQTFNENVTVTSKSDDSVLIWFKTDKIAEKHISTLHSSTKELERKSETLLEKNAKKKSNRTYSGEKTLHLGSWRKMQSDAFITAETKLTQSIKWLGENERLFTLVSNIFKQSFPNLYSYYINDIIGKVPFRIGVFSTISINFNYGEIIEHTDTTDCRTGMC